jgi:uncharacterized protein YbjT (DUF2867 family)
MPASLAGGWRSGSSLPAPAFVSRCATSRAKAALRAAGLEAVHVVRGDVRERASVSEALAGADAAVNAVSAYVEKGGVTFAAVHEEGRRHRWHSRARPPPVGENSVR